MSDHLFRPQFERLLLAARRSRKIWCSCSSAAKAVLSESSVSRSTYWTMSLQDLEANKMPSVTLPVIFEDVSVSTARMTRIRSWDQALAWYCARRTLLQMCRIGPVINISSETCARFEKARVQIVLASSASQCAPYEKLTIFHSIALLSLCGWYCKNLSVFTERPRIEASPTSMIKQTSLDLSLTLKPSRSPNRASCTFFGREKFPTDHFELRVVLATGLLRSASANMPATEIGFAAVPDAALPSAALPSAAVPAAAAAVRWPRESAPRRCPASSSCVGSAAVLFIRDSSKRSSAASQSIPRSILMGTSFSGNCEGVWIFSERSLPSSIKTLRPAKF
mmetsp:Transcript_25795/g.86683  ORF Transcript_25795/g.86683 Transcript_25795/m.86683 type:complete len:337 (-) Transcript_25795:1484-2494(-)